VLGIEPDDTVSPGVLKKMVYAGANASSFEQASRDLAEEAELSIAAPRIRRATERVGQERLALRGEAVERWRKLSLPEQRRSPHEHVPQVACVQVDGGRVQIRQRLEPAAGQRTEKGFWRESKVACLLRMHSQAHSVDPCPTLPAGFANIARMAELCREIKGFSGVERQSDESADERDSERVGRPRVLTRNVLAMRASSEKFGEHVAALAWECGFAAAPRKAFVADGQEANWTLWKRCFSHYTPILDFVHAVCYVFQAAAAARPLDEVAEVYRRWAQAVWSGRVQDVISELEARQQKLGVPEESSPDTDPRHVVAKALGYLRHQASRMRYDAYRQQGLPITSAYVESTIKQINRRVKGSEKFWCQGGAEALLQLAGDYLSDRLPLDQYWRHRPETAIGQRSYH
jgi:hypothetical protein